MNRRALIKRLRKVVAAFAAEPANRFVLQLPGGKTAQWSGANMRDYFAAVADLMEANSRHDQKAQAAALTKLATADITNDLPPDEIDAVWKQLFN
jgi:hypothetical protein